ncbi:MAG: TonB-dependent receptor, partial [Cyclobacteriaceae bacterium]|nr:TonB-dependent receptor [Cyclobacteriaceae bacterium]
MKKLLLIIIAIVQFSSVALSQQKTINGSVTDASTGEAIVGANVVLKGTTTGVVTDLNGKFSMQVGPDATITISFIGYEPIDIAVGNRTVIDVKMVSGSTELEELVFVGTRSTPRSSTDTPVPVDIIGADDLVSTGQTTFDKALQYRIPSFNTVQTPVNDATSLLDPYEIRNMGPSRTLILVNGKRKNLSALLYTQTSPGRGETGADISAIPTDAIKRVEILRDGASAQYGSDAIAGVMNIILKDGSDGGSATVRSGITSQGDGGMFGVSVNNGVALGKGDGFLNITTEFSKVNLANRPGTVDADGEAADFGAPLADVQAFLAAYPDAGNINGSPETTSAKFLVNGEVEVNENSEVYFNAAYVYKKVNSFANYRTPYWRTLTDYPYLADLFPNGPNGSYIGYVPTFDGDLADYNATIGYHTIENGWNTDMSLTTGKNTQTYTVTNSHNRSTDAGGNFIYGSASPITFRPGGTSFHHIVGNIDVSKSLNDIFSISLGSEFRSETFDVIQGDEASYLGIGADSFAGNTPENSGSFNRYNFGGYFDLAMDITKDFLVNATVRTENYSDFGNAFVWKVSSRYKLADDKIVLRGSVSTGFRAPTLHQIYTQKAQYSFIPGQGIQVGGLVSNVSAQASLIGIPKLDAEQSINFTYGIGTQINKNFNITADYYNIAVKNRIVLSTEIGATASGTTPLDQILISNNLSDLSFFVNAIDTRTSGVDVVANYRNINLGMGQLAFNLAGNYTIFNGLDGDVKIPTLIAGAGQSVVNETQEALFFTSRPKTKWITGIGYEINKIGFSLNNTLFGKTTFRQQGMDSNLKTEFIPKVVTDLGFT